jgi:chemotaxis receptor (MCP) glutamine deamidase CheD
MLPGSSSHSRWGYDTKYAKDAVDDMLYKMRRLKAESTRIEACLVGGGNVLKDTNDSLCRALIASVRGLLQGTGVMIIALALGGEVRRGVSLDVGNGTVDYFEGEGLTCRLYAWRSIS